MPWYRRLADIREVGYSGSPGVQRDKLPGYNLKPEVKHYDVGGRRVESLWWDDQGRSSSASPATTWAQQAVPEPATPQAVLQRLYEALELPGEASNYHFAIQNCHEALWHHRYEHPWVVPEIERLCWLDIRLLEADPKILQFEVQGGKVSYGRSRAFERLIRLYERNGYLAEALDVAQRAVRFHAEESITQPIRERLAQLEEEQ